MKRVALITTGGTIEKTYDIFSGTLANHVSNLEMMLSQLELRGVELYRVPLMNKDSLEMSPQDHKRIAASVVDESAEVDGVIVVHGTDRLAESGETILARAMKHGGPRCPIVLTGAMRPYELKNSDAEQNLTEALLAVQILGPGVYAVMQNQVLSFPGVVKNKENACFEQLATR